MSHKCFYLRLDFAAGRPAGADFDLLLEFLTPDSVCRFEATRER